MALASHGRQITRSRTGFLPCHRDNASVWLLLLLCLVAMPGCGGCSRYDPKRPLTDVEKRAEELRKKKEEQQAKPDFQFRQLNTLPNPVGIERAVKPGHWSSGDLLAIANNFDYRGQLAVEAFDLDDMPFRLGTSRPAVLAKGQRRDLGLVFFPPAILNPRSVAANLHTDRGGATYREAFPLTRMPTHQYYMVVLAQAPEEFMFLRDLDTIRTPSAEFGTPGSEAHFRLLIPAVKKTVPLPTQSLLWTTISCLVWDKFDPQKLTADQQQALLDWLHWGGQIVVSGPQTLGMLKGSFLDPYLPAQSEGTMELSPDALQELAARWSDPELPLKLVKPWPAERLKLNPDARTLVQADDSAIVVDRSVGRGRIVLTAFPLAGRSLFEWSGFDSFFNGCLLLRPARKFKFEEADVIVAWQDGAQIKNPARVTGLRYFTRDAGSDRGIFSPVVQPAATNNSAPQNPDPFETVSFTDFDSSDNYQPGLAGWNDSGLIANQARRSLRDAAGIKIPSPQFVISAVVAYLIVLIPLNWGFFRLLGKVEWAWIAAPIISLAGAILVVRAAQLDIGFVRATNEIAVLEIQPNYPRAHVTRYAALYTSLSTTYQAQFEDLGALAMPFPDGSGVLSGQNRTTVTLRSGNKISLDGFQVGSNSLGLLHAEHMLPIDGQLELNEVDGVFTVTNHTPWRINDAQVVHAGQLANVGSLPPDVTRPIRLDLALPDNKEAMQEFLDAARSAAQTDATEMDASSESLNSADATEPGEVDLRPLFALAARAANPDEWCVVGWLSDLLPGMTVVPAAAQQRHRTIVVAHLRTAPLAQPARDGVMRSEVERDNEIKLRRVEIDSP